MRLFVALELSNVGAFRNSRASPSNAQEFLLLRVFHSNQKPVDTILLILSFLPIWIFPSADCPTVISCGFYQGFLTGSCFGVYSGLFRLLQKSYRNPIKLLLKCPTHLLFHPIFVQNMTTHAVKYYVLQLNCRAAQLLKGSCQSDEKEQFTTG